MNRAGRVGEAASPARRGTPGKAAVSRRAWLAAPLLAVLATGVPGTAAGAAVRQGPAVVGRPARAGAVPAAALIIRRSSPALVFRWRAPPEAAEAPALLAALRAEALRTAAKGRAVAQRDAAAAAKAGFPFRAYETVADWSLAADTPRLLALAGETYSFTGGAHGNTGFAVRLWDKAGRRAIAFDALFTDWPRARMLIEPAFCAALARMQAERRGGAKTGGDFEACPRLSEQPLVPWGGLSARAGQFRVLLGPYVAGPYSEGSYLVTAPWPEALRPLVRPVYRRDLFGDG